MIVAEVTVGIPTLVEIPVIGMVGKRDARHRDAGVGMPAIAFAVAGDIGRGRRRHGDKGARGDRSAEGSLDEKFSGVHVYAPHGLSHPLHRKERLCQNYVPDTLRPFSGVDGATLHFANQAAGGRVNGRSGLPSNWIFIAICFPGRRASDGRA
jgi:hypothetical protein